jgi:hypothetical protein
MSKKLGCLEWWWLGGIYSPNHQTNRWGGCLLMGALNSLMRQSRHPTIRVLTVSTVGALTSWCTGQSGVASDMHCSLSGAPSGAALTLRELPAHCSRYRRSLEMTVTLDSRCSAWCTGQSGGPLDSSVNYSGAAPEKPEGEEFSLYGPWCTRHCPVAHRTVRCARPGFSLVSFAPFF